MSEWGASGSQIISGWSFGTILFLPFSKSKVVPSSCKEKEV